MVVASTVVAVWHHVSLPQSRAELPGTINARLMDDGSLDAAGVRAGPAVIEITAVQWFAAHGLF